MIENFHLSVSFPCVRAKACEAACIILNANPPTVGSSVRTIQPMIGQQRSCTIATYPALFHFSLHSTEYLPLSL